MIGAELDGRYRIVGELGQGGMGDVYLAEHIQLGRQEAIKLLRPELEWSPELVARLRREARAINRLHHPNIVSLYDFGRLPDGRYYLSMELAEGESLRAILAREAPLAIPRAIELLVQLCNALDHAHERGVIHRDLKPSNLILSDYRGHPLLKVLDFGLAKIIDSSLHESHHTSSGAINGTPAYMAPERFLGPAHDARTDIYSLGCIAFEMLTGKAPFEGWLVALSQAHLNKPPPRPSAVRAGRGIPDELDELVLSCLEKQPGNRPQTARQVAVSLSALLERAGTLEGRRRNRTINWLQMTIGDDATVVSDSSRQHATESNSARDDEAARRKSLRRAADALIDDGCSDVGLVLAASEIDSLTRADEALIDELEDLERQCERTDHTAHEREAALRFNLGEVRLARARAEAPSDNAIEEAIEQKLRSLGRELVDSVARHDAEMRRITDREVEVVTELARRNEVLEQAYAELSTTIVRALRGYAETPNREAIAHLAEAQRIGQPETSSVRSKQPIDG